MMNSMKRKNLLAYILLLPFLFSCHKEFLDKKPDKALLVPTTLADFRALLDYDIEMNVSPGLNIISDGDYSIPDNVLNSFSSTYIAKAYTWSADILTGQSVLADWSSMYRQVFCSNMTLEGLEKITRTAINQKEYDDLKGSAFFYRAFALYQLAQTFAPPYAAATAASEKGIPMRLTSDINTAIPLPTLAAVYQQIEADAGAALPLLQDTAAFRTRPSRNAVLALQARLYLTMGQYELALQSAQQSLDINSQLLEYHTYDSTLNRTFPYPYNKEVIYYSTLRSHSFQTSASTTVAPALYASYAPADLRRPLYFRNRGNNIYTYKGSYAYSSDLGGFANDEMYLIVAECLARQGLTLEAMQALNTLLEKRWKKDEFVPYEAGDPEEALRMVLTERRKELISRGIRWADLRRLNQDERFKTTLTRVSNGVTYTLPPGSDRYVFPFPDDER